MSSKNKILKLHADHELKLRNIIENYPEELLLLIFGYVDPESLGRLTLVNKRWHEIVTRNISTMMCLPLTIRLPKLERKRFIVENRMFYEVNFIQMEKTYNAENVASLKKMGSNVREINFIDCHVRNNNEYQRILNNFPKVEKLSFVQCSFYYPYQKLEANVFKSENLTSLELQDSCFLILHIIEAQVKRLSICLMNFFGRTTQAETEQPLMKFLYTQKRLEDLVLVIEFEIWSLCDKTEHQFKLKELSLISTDLENESQTFKHENLIDFLNTQKDSLESLAFRSQFPKDVLKVCLNNFKSVKTLVYLDGLTDFNIIKINKNVTKLVLLGKVIDDVRFFSIFPNLTDLSFFKEISFQALYRLSNVCKALTSLSLNNMLPGNYRNVKFTALKKFHLLAFDGGHDWSDFVNSNPSIETLSFITVNAYCEFNTNEIKNVFEQMPNLKQLTLEKQLSILKYTGYHLDVDTARVYFAYFKILAWLYT
ncbi:unnamed protein product [Diamesa hyperborea]